jgi:hypothetical protein
VLEYLSRSFPPCFSSTNHTPLPHKLRQPYPNHSTSESFKKHSTTKPLTTPWHPKQIPSLHPARFVRSMVRDTTLSFIMSSLANTSVFPLLRVAEAGKPSGVAATVDVADAHHRIQHISNYLQPASPCTKDTYRTPALLQPLRISLAFTMIPRYGWLLAQSALQQAHHYENDALPPLPMA